jgi:hypothetical protein
MIEGCFASVFGENARCLKSETAIERSAMRNFVRVCCKHDLRVTREAMPSAQGERPVLMREVGPDHQEA